MMRWRLGIGAGLLAISILTFGYDDVIAGPLTGPVWLDDTPEVGTALFTHDDILFDASHSGAFISPHGYWFLVLDQIGELEKIPPLLPDTVQMVGSLTHNVGPHPGDDPIGPTFFFDLILFADDAVGGVVLATQGDTLSHPSIGHVDVFTASASARVAAGNLDITSYNLTVSGVHVPEPPSVTLLGAGLTILFANIRRRWGMLQRHLGNVSSHR